MDADLHAPTGRPIAAATVLHPHPGMGGDRHHPLVVAIADAFVASGVAALRVDLPNPDADAAVPALETAAAKLLDEVAADHLYLVGYSWGAAVSARAKPEGLVARVLVAPPVKMLELPLDGGVPTLVLVPAHDQFGPPDAVAELIADRPSITMEIIEGCDHFLAGAVARIATRTVEWLTA